MWLWLQRRRWSSCTTSLLQQQCLLVAGSEKGFSGNAYVLVEPNQQEQIASKHSLELTLFPGVGLHWGALTSFSAQATSGNEVFISIVSWRCCVWLEGRCFHCSLAGSSLCHMAVCLAGQSVSAVERPWILCG
jgi:hypothetical protein